ncbi:MAG: hypothetical protein SCALA702_35600 [Melioribacteraceae bacterium]|nr:MAG: hypothetical protein SCALA702_35600 [Melioribacteraceae bacterium]
MNTSGKIVFILLFFNALVFSQGYTNITTVTDSFKVDLKNRYFLSATNYLPATFELSLNDSVLNSSAYELFGDEGYFALSEDVKYSIFDTLVAKYQTLKLGLTKVIRKRELVTQYNEETGLSISVIRESYSQYSSDDIFGSKLQKSGTIVRGFTVGTTKDFTLNSGLRLQLSGQLSDNIEIVAALTDENTPIQPEGNTERLEELDKVFIEIRHPNAIGTFGDYELNENHGEFGKLQRKLQGLKGEFFYENNRLMTSVAASRGKYNSNSFNGRDGVQGPYRITGANGEKEIIIIAGSERVYLDGAEMQRGENNDYIIEYANAEVTFTANRLITSASRITIEFEYTDRKYTRNFFGGNVSTGFWDDRLKISFTYAREGDDERNPVDFILSDDDYDVLEQAGDDRVAAATNGVSLGGVDSLGNNVGIYSRIDTVFNGEPYELYKYTPGDPEAIYIVDFSFVGTNSGDYERVSVGNFRFAGIGNGDYLPVRLLPLPELKQNGVIRVEAEPFRDILLSAEIAGSIYDRNSISEKDDEDNNGLARNIAINMKPKEITLFGNSIGKVGFKLRDRLVEARYSSLDRFNEVEFDRDYNTDNSVSGDEVLREAEIRLNPIDKLNVYGKYGYLKKGTGFTSNRYLSNVSYQKTEGVSGEYKFDYVESKSSIRKSNWNRQSGNIGYVIGYFTPGVDFDCEDKKETKPNSDSLLISSLQFSEVGPYLNINSLHGFTFGIRYSNRIEQTPLNGILQKESEAITQNYTLQYSGIREVRSSLSVSLRDKKYTEKFKALGNLNSETVLIRTQNKLQFLKRAINGEIFYETTSQRAARLEKVFIRVPQGQGNYLYIGDLNNNGVADENEFQQTNFDGNFIQTTLPTDELFPVVDFKANTRWNISFDKLLGDKSFVGKLLSPVSTDTYWRIEEKSRETDTKKIYLMNLKYFLSDSNTVRGSNTFQNDLYLFRTSSEFSIRYRFTQRKNLNQYSVGLEKGFYKEHAVRVKYRFVKEITNQTEFTSTIDNVTAPASSGRARTVDGNEISTDFSYRPINILEVGFVVKAGRQEDFYPVTPTIIDNNTQILRVNLSFAGKGRIRFEAERTEISANTENNVIPFEITRGNYIGKNYYLRLNFDYRVASNLQTSLTYDGRAPAGSKLIHTFKAEARAYF